MKARRKAVRYGNTSVMIPGLMGPSRSVRRQVDNLLLRQMANPDSLTAALGQVEAAEALSAYVYMCRSMDVHATRLRLNEIASSAGKVVLGKPRGSATLITLCRSITHLYHRLSAPVDS